MATKNRDIQGILQGLFNFTVAKKLQWYLLVIAGCASIIALVAPHLVEGKRVIEANSSLFAGVILSMLLVFRTNSAYDRWWEGRRAWGQLVNDLRNLSIKYYEFVRPNLQEREAFAKLLIRFAYGMKDHLRMLDSTHSRAPECDNPVSEHPMLIVEEIYAVLDQKRREGRLNDMMFNVVDPHARALLDVLGSCERIATSPITESHKSIILHIIVTYLLFVSFALAPEFGIWSVPVVLVGAYMVLGLEIVAEEKEHPFGTAEEDLPLDRICNNIERSVNKLLLCDSLLERDIEWGHTVRVLPKAEVEILAKETTR
ncbi:MAG TPA: bestrophin family ion channel [Candidatus Melainabacteria bacterium]|nr:bestrophin family ion channel [Candidatus Melainabacteria bacterium]